MIRTGGDTSFSISRDVSLLDVNHGSSFLE